MDKAPVLRDGDRVLGPGRGLFVEALRSATGNAGRTIPFIDIPEVEEASDLEAAPAEGY